MYQRIACIVTLAFSLSFTQAALADSWGCGEGMKTIIASLKLDDAQKAKIKPVLDELKSRMQETGAQMSALETEMNQQVESNTMNQRSVDDVIDKKTKLIGDMMKAKMTARHQIVAVLNDHQKSEFHQKMKKLEDKISAKFKSCHAED